MKKRIFFQQAHPDDNGLTCLKMLLAYHGKDYSIEYLRTICPPDEIEFEESKKRLENLAVGAQQVGFMTFVQNFIFIQLALEVHLPAILSWDEDYHVVLYEIKKSFWSFLPWVSKEEVMLIADPKTGFRKVEKQRFLEDWREVDSRKGFVLSMHPKAIEFKKISRR